MDYQDASNSPNATDTSSTGSSPVARPDVDGLSPGSMGPATGNTITGGGTITGTAGADSLGDAPASIVTVQGAGGTASPAGAAAQVSGQYGVLTIDAQGNFSYVRNGGTPDGVEDVFGYTLADRDGSTSNSTLTIQIGQTQSAALDGVVNLPAGVELSDIRVQGRDLVVTLPDGSTMLIPGGAVFVPQLVIGDTQVPASNVAALLVNSEAPAPAAGSLQSSGGNFANPVPPLDPGVPLGDLIPPTELAFPQPDFEEIGQDIDEEPEAGLASAELDDDEQSNGNAGGVGDDPFGATDSGFLPGSDGDGNLEWALLATGAPTGFSYVAQPDGSLLVFQNGNANAVLSITVNPNTGGFVVTQLGPIAHEAGSDENNLTLPISYSVTDEDNDSAIGTLNVNIDDDTPIARNDTDALAAGQKTTDGNVITAVGTTSAPGSADSPGADGLGTPGSATDGVNGILAGTSGSFTTVPVGGVTINGSFGSLLINQNGSYVYTRFDNARQGGTDVFTYKIFDGDGDETTATLTITVPADPIPVPAVATAIVDDDGLVAGDQDDGDGDDPVANDPDNNQATYVGTLSANFSTDVPGSFNLSAMNNLTATVGQETVRYGWNAGTGVLTATIEGGPRNGLVLFTVDIDATADPSSDQFTVTLVRNVLHEDQVANTENNATVVLNFTAVDSNGDTANSTLTITFDDDMPTAATPNASELPTLTVDESPLPGAGDGDNSDSANFSFAFVGGFIGADQLGREDDGVSYSLTLSTQGAASGLFALDPADTETAVDPLGKGASITLHNVDAQTIEGRVGGTVYFTITVDDTGEVTLTRNPAVNLWHGDTLSDDDAQVLSAALNTLGLQQTITDSDGDSASATLDLSTGVFRFEDDGPRADNPTGFQAVQLVVDESPLPPNGDGDNSDSHDYSGAFTGFFDFGTDGPGDQQFALILNTEGAASGLFALDPSDTDPAGGLGKGASITLHTNGNVIEGRVGATVYFTISVDADTGIVTLTRSASLNLWNDNVSDHDDPEILTAAANTLQLQMTVIDADGDTDSAVIDLSAGIFRFEDDGPDATVNEVFTKPVLIVDESPLSEDGDNSDSAAFAGAFGAVIDYGTDGPGDVTYQLVLGLEGAASGLFALDPADTEIAIDPLGKGASITLHTVNSTTVEGRVGANVYFTISVNADSGVVTLTRNPAFNMWHDLAGHNAAAHDDPEILTALANTLKLQQTVIDADGDTDTAQIDLSTGVFRFEDDGPSADNETNAVEEGATLTVNAAGGVLVGDDFGTDGPGALIGVAKGSNTGIAVTGNVGVQIDGDFGKLTLNADGSYTYVSTDGLAPPGGATDTFVYTIRDADGDTVTATLTINISDDTPPQGGNVLNLEVDDDALADGNNAASNDEIASGTIAFTAGSDPLTTFAFAAGTGTLGGALTWTRVSDTLIEGRDGGTLVISLTLTPPAGGTIAAGATGTVTVTATLHNNYDSHPGVNVDDLLALGSVTVRASEADPADFATGTVNLSVSDDVPINNNNLYDVGDVHEDALAGGNSSGEGAKTATIQILGASLANLVSPGADNPVTITLNGATVGNPGSIEGTATGLTQNGVSIVWDVVSATEMRGVIGGSVIFTITDNPGDSNFTFTLLDNIDHDSDNPLNLSTGTSDSFVETLSLAGVFKATDQDNDSVIINAGATIDIENDVPIAAIVENNVNVSLDESAGNQLDSNDVNPPRPEFDGVANKGDDLDVAGTGAIQFAFNNNAVVSSTGTLPGADGLVSTVFSLTTSNPGGGTDSGLDTTEGVNIWLFIENGVVVGRVGATALAASTGPAAFAIAIDQAGKISMVEYLSIQHNLNGLDPDDSVSILDGALKAVVTVKDSDGDSHSATTDIGNRIIFQDSGPIMTAASNINIQNSADVAANGTFAYDLGADGARTDNDVFKTVTFSAVVNGNTVQTTTPLTQVSETASTAVFSFSFTYATGPGTPPPTTTTNGTITFYKDNSVVGHPAGTYTVDLDSQIAGFSINQTGGLPSDAFQGYIEGTSTEDNTGTPAVSVASIASDLFLQFTGQKEPSNGPNADGTHTTTSGDLTFNNGEFFVNDPTGVSTSGSAAGVAGDTMNPDEILTFNLYATDPTGITGGLPTQSASNMFLKFDGIGASEDFIVILRLWSDTNGNGTIDAVGDTFTTKAVLVENADIIKGSGTVTAGPGAYSGVSLDNNDGLVIIESNDYNELGQTFKIIGAQVLTDPADVDGTAINLNPTIGPTGGSDGPDVGTALDTQLISDDNNDNAPMKISSVGFLRTTTTAQNATLTFNVTIQDGDNDPITQTVTASVTSAADSSTPIVLGAPVTTIQSAPVQESLASNDNTLQKFATSTSSNSLMIGALAAVGMTSPAYSVSFDDNDGSGKLVASVTYDSQAGVDGGPSVDVAAASAGDLAGDASVAPATVVESTAPASDDAGDTSLTDSEPAADTQPAELDAGTDAPVAESSTSPLIAQDIMLPAEMLEGGDGGSSGVQHNAIVEKVLVDALNGGGDGPNLDALINAVSGDAHNLQPIATLEPAIVPAGDSADFAGFTAGLEMPILEQMVMHQDAAPAQV